MDAYDKAVAWLTEHPTQIHSAWARNNQAGFLFAHASHDGNGHYHDGVHWCGCLTQIRSAEDAGAFLQVHYLAVLTAEIKEDDRIPKPPNDITVDHLPVFAEWHRRLDKEIGRKPPVWEGD